jgi:hypothetical protein
MPPAPAGEQDEIEGRAPTPEEARPSVEAAFADESYRPGNDRGTHRGAWIVRRAQASSWAFAGTDLGAGDGRT